MAKLEYNTYSRDVGRMRAELRRAIRRLVRAELGDSWSGGGDPEMIPVWEKELEAARKHLNSVIEKVLPK